MYARTILHCLYSFSTCFMTTITEETNKIQLRRCLSRDAGEFDFHNTYTRYFIRYFTSI